MPARIPHLRLALGILLFAAMPLRAATIVVNIGSGYLFDAAGTSEANRLPVDTLCLLVADMDGDGFDPLTDAGWVAGDDRLITIFDSEFPSPGSRGFDLAAAQTEPGFFSRSLGIDLAQFAAYSTPLPFALRWFPTYRAATTNLNGAPPPADTPYGEFSRAVPRYSGTEGWFIPVSGGENFTVDPFATSDFGGTDLPENGRATHSVIIVPEPSVTLSILLGGAVCLSARGRRTLPRRSEIPQVRLGAGK